MQSSVKRRRLAALDKLSGGGNSSPGGQGKATSRGGSGSQQGSSPTGSTASGSQGLRARQQQQGQSKSRSPSAQREVGWSHRNSPQGMAASGQGAGSAAAGSRGRQRHTAEQQYSASPGAAAAAALGPALAQQSQQGEERHAVYHPLPAGQIAAAAAEGLKIGTAKTVGEGRDELLLGLLATSSRRLNGWEVIQSKVRDKMIMLDNPANQPSSAQGSRKRKDDGGVAAARLLQSGVQCRKAGVRLDPPLGRLPDSSTHGARIPQEAEAELQEAADALHQKWKEHILEFMPQGETAVKEFLRQSGFLGCRLRVKQARQACQVGCRGVVVRETASCLHILDEEAGRLKALSKLGAVLECRLPMAAVATYGGGAAKPSLTMSGAVLEVLGDRIIARQAGTKR